MQEEFEAIDTVATIVNRITRYGQFADWELANGIVLTVKPIPPYLLTAVNNAYNPPEPPKVLIEEKGREEPNPNDPAYLKKLDELETKRQLAINDLVLAMGTELKSVPEGYVRPDEDGWEDKINFANKLLGIDIKVDKEDPIKRYLSWLRFYALVDSNDVALAQTLPMVVAGIREEEIDAVINSFRSLPERGSDTDGEPETINSNGHTANRAARRASARDRRA